MTKVVQYTYHNANVKSTAIDEIWYSSTARELYVRFGNGQVAGYADVSPLAADKLIDASSVGSHYAHYIKPNYPGVNTKDVEFRAAPGLAKKTTDVPVHKAYSVYTAPVVPKPTQRFYVNGTILKPVTHGETFVAASFEDAIAQFRKKYADKEPEVKEVRSV